MAIMAAEAVESAGAGGARVARRAGQGVRALPPPRRRVVNARVIDSRTEAPRSRQRRRPRVSPAVQQAAGQAAGAYAGAARGGARAIGAAQIPGDRAYQPVILAEFIAAALLVTLAPIAQPSTSGTGSPSPYDTNDLKQLVGIGAVYFVLALVASGNHGRLAAWFGGLILIAIGMGKLPGGQLKAIFSVVGQGPSVSPGSTQVA